MTRHVASNRCTEDFVIGNCRAMFACPRKWSKLVPTADTSIRRCSSCNEFVFRCRNADELELNVKAGRCVAVFVGELEAPMFLGQMHVDYQPGYKLNV